MTYPSNLFYGASISMHQKARELRKRSIPAERKLWEILQNKQLDGHKFRRQHPIRHGAQVLKIHSRFLLPWAARLVIELDGEVHNDDDQREHDINRDPVIKEYTIRILRFKNEEIMNGLPKVLECVRSYMTSIKSEYWLLGSDSVVSTTPSHLMWNTCVSF